MGLATAKLLASRGATVSLADINETALKTTTESLAGSNKHMYMVVDVRESKSVDAWIQSTVEKLGKLDGAVNMAGVISPAKSITEETDETWDFNFAVNARGIFFCLRAQLRAMSAGGSIVSVNDLFFYRRLLIPSVRSPLRASLAKWVLQVWLPIAPAKLRLLEYLERQQRRTKTSESTACRLVSNNHSELWDVRLLTVTRRFC